MKTITDLQWEDITTIGGTSTFGENRRFTLLPFVCMKCGKVKLMLSKFEGLAQNCHLLCDCGGDFKSRRFL